MLETPKIAALIVAAGTGQRVGGAVAKQYQPLHGQPLLRHSLQALLAHPAIGPVQVVIHPEHAARYGEATAGLSLLPPVIGGAERAFSVRAGLAALAAHAPERVLIHDAARPFLSAVLLDRLLAEGDDETAVVPALPVVDTVRRYRDGGWQEVPREGLLRIQTPQLFPYAALATLHAQSSAALTDDAALWLDAGLPLRYVEGEERLRKMTTAADFIWAEQLAPRRIVTGSGFDVHRLVPAGDKPGLRMGGIDIPHSHALLGHSDADVALHAITDALLGALGAGDIGAHFPPSDARWKGADSETFVREAMRLLQSRAGQLQHVDLTILCEAPKIGPHREAMRTRIAAMLGVGTDFISVKATTTEGLGFTGRGEGIAAQATATVSLPC
jgi:2-C-methyl-D-erythritol 4-phosphate cytidylyltransferase/2-C-methyl-D-erythritol 2,4-cyclodiphosphate synthase